MKYTYAAFASRINDGICNDSVYLGDDHLRLGFVHIAATHPAIYEDIDQGGSIRSLGFGRRSGTNLPL